MSLLSLSPTQLPRTGASAPLNLTTLMAAGTLGSNTGVTWANTGREFLVIAVASGGSTCSIPIGTTIEGQAVAPLTPTLTASATNVIGPFPSDETLGGVMTVNFGTAANVTVALVQYIGVI
ncbi:hypothetical protein OG455_41195 [Kitasatospora sp. NBC_01287]|uniref:hypothetical protein n=1 Tax=Kitasatospora sp. NBC_01287 TaxID=2903573 RepID=UPI0022575FD6|nr:hypothetical protein [Kitasatospora sp. NBC_01287]MCX4750899.1 hypothetical protein [Kitasatospora sp. NBC_01287]MCX4751858.1 hypothetical protein [Kitasatospora sp. NBC_01287]